MRIMPGPRRRARLFHRREKIFGRQLNFANVELDNVTYSCARQGNLDKTGLRAFCIFQWSNETGGVREEGDTNQQ